MFLLLFILLFYLIFYYLINNYLQNIYNIIHFYILFIYLCIICFYVCLFVCMIDILTVETDYKTGLFRLLLRNNQSTDESLSIGGWLLFKIAFNEINSLHLWLTILQERKLSLIS